MEFWKILDVWAFREICFSPILKPYCHLLVPNMLLNKKCTGLAVESACFRRLLGNKTKKSPPLHHCCMILHTSGDFLAEEHCDPSSFVIFEEMSGVMAMPLATTLRTAAPTVPVTSVAVPVQPAAVPWRNVLGCTKQANMGSLNAKLSLSVVNLPNFFCGAGFPTKKN